MNRSTLREGDVLIYVHDGAAFVVRLVRPARAPELLAPAFGPAVPLAEAGVANGAGDGYYACPPELAERVRW